MQCWPWIKPTSESSESYLKSRHCSKFPKSTELPNEMPDWNFVHESNTEKNQIDFHDESSDWFFLHSSAHIALFARDSEKNFICASHLTSSTFLKWFPSSPCTALAIKSRKIAENFSIAVQTRDDYRNEILQILDWNLIGSCQTLSALEIDFYFTDDCVEIVDNYFGKIKNVEVNASGRRIFWDKSNPYIEAFWIRCN